MSTATATRHPGERAEGLQPARAPAWGRHVRTSRVVLDPNSESALEPDEILVCGTIDPSSVSLFVLVGAPVIDVGGPLSHGVIVARELGLPCVINTRTGTRALRTGDRVRVDGDKGEVVRLHDR